MKFLLATFGVVSVLLAATAGRYGPMAQVTKDPLGMAALAVVLLASAQGPPSDQPDAPSQLEALPVGAKVAAVAVFKLLGQGEPRAPETASR